MRSGLVLLMVLSMAALPGCDRGPRGFSGQSYDKALAEAQASGRLLLLDATATWCGPCKMMDRTTWADERVLSWIGKHAIAVRLDVDRDPHRAQALRIEAMPTIVVFKDGAEFDRVVGYQSADDLLAWLDGVVEGRRRQQRRTRRGDRGVHLALGAHDLAWTGDERRAALFHGGRHAATGRVP
jgi:thiol-disulfide isomerase/thioredoxin